MTSKAIALDELKNCSQAMQKDPWAIHGMMQALLERDFKLLVSTITWLASQYEDPNSEKYVGEVFLYDGCSTQYEILAEAFINVDIEDGIHFFRSLIYPVLETVIGDVN